MQGHTARMGPRAVFPQINSLPGSQRELAGVNREGEVHRRQRGADVGGHVVVAFGGVGEQRVAVAHEPCKKGGEVAAHVRVGVFLDQERGGSMAQVQGEQPVAEFICGNTARAPIRAMWPCISSGNNPHHRHPHFSSLI